MVTYMSYTYFDVGESISELRFHVYTRDRHQNADSKRRKSRISAVRALSHPRSRDTLVGDAWTPARVIP
jgi:hypothetical protein